MKKYGTLLTVGIVTLASVGVLFYVFHTTIPELGSVAYESGVSDVEAAAIEPITEEPDTPTYVASHVEMPEQVKTLYMTSWVAGTPSIRKGIVDLIEATEINSILIDIKDDTGKISFDVYDPYLEDIGSEEIRIGDLREFIAMLHKKGIYVIGRIATFQDPHLVTVWPEHAVKTESDTSVIWEDRKGLSWMDAGSKKVWDYAIAIGKEAYAAGFDELNYDYIRFPSDGDMNDIYYPISEEATLLDPDFGKAKVIEDFFEYLSEAFEGSGAVLSADLFGMVTTNSDDLNIGQVLERALPYFDVVAPMTYPSHYPNNFIGLGNPAEHPYEVIKYSMDEANKKVAAFNARMASTTPGYDISDTAEIRPWLQDFNLGATYDAAKVRAQIQAVYDSGLDSWMIWDASNTYTRGALLGNE